jgi:ribosomal-protein-alanine N-acetyltransferase
VALGEDVRVTEVGVRPAGPTDLESVAGLEQVCLGQDAWSRGLVAHGLSGTLPTVTYLVAEIGGEVVGHAVVSLAGDVAELQRIGVHPERRRLGVASRLLAAVVALPGEQQRLLLEVRDDNAGALELYAGHGFTELARRPGYYADGTAAVVLELPLRR